MFWNFARTMLGPPSGGGTRIFFRTGTYPCTRYHFKDINAGRGYHFVEISSMTGSIFVMLTPKVRFRPFALCECDSNRLAGNISTFFDRFRTNFLAEH